MGGPPNGGASRGAFALISMDDMHRWYAHLGIHYISAFPLESESDRILHELIVGCLGNSLSCCQLLNLFAWNITVHLFIHFAQKSHGESNGFSCLWLTKEAVMLQKLQSPEYIWSLEHILGFWLWGPLEHLDPWPTRAGPAAFLHSFASLFARCS